MLQLLRQAVELAGYTGKICIAMDVAASEFCKDHKYDLDFKNPQSDPSAYVIFDLRPLSFFLFFNIISLNFQLSGEQLGALYHKFIEECKGTCPVVSIEDGFDQDDWENWTKFQTSTGIQLVGYALLHYCNSASNR